MQVLQQKVRNLCVKSEHTFFMRDDPVKKLIEGDELIIRLGASLICRKGKAQKKNICDKLKILGRFVLA